MDCERLNSPVLSFVDINGKPLVGGKLYTYLAGTSTPATTYRDIEGTDANENPIVLNGRGECVCFLDCSKTYKVVLKDSHDVVIWSQDNVFPNNIAELARVVVDNSDAIDELNDKKADKVPGATDNNFAALDANGNLKDSGKKASDFAPSSLGDVAVRTDVVQNFNDEKLKQGRDNIKAQKYVGGPGSFVDDLTVDQDNLWANIGSIDLAALGIGGRYSNCFTNISLSLEVTVYNTGSADSEIVEHGRFNINIHAEPSNGKWIVDAGWAEYKGRGNTRLVELMRVSRNNGNGGAIDKITLHAKVPEPSTFYTNAVNVSVLNNYGSIHKNDSLNSTKAIIAPWSLNLGVVFENFFGMNENVVPIGKYIASSYDSYVDYSTFSVAKFELLDNYSAFAGYASANRRGNIPVAKNGEGVIAQTIKSTDSEAKIATMTEKSIRVARFNSGGVTVLNQARLQSVNFMTPDIDIDTVGSYLIGEDYIYPTQGQAHSISVFFEVVYAGVEQFYVNASWLRLGFDNPKEFKICATYYDTNGTVGIWNGTKVLTNEEERLFVTFYDAMHKLEIDFISTDGERWYHFEYIKEANRSRMVEY